MMFMSLWAYGDLIVHLSSKGCPAEPNLFLHIYTLTLAGNQQGSVLATLQWCFAVDHLQWGETDASTVFVTGS